jgi:CheY-like chemotaxis protein
MGARILLIEDNVPSLVLMSYLLKAGGHDPTSARDGSDGVRKALEGDFDLIVTDILMPHMDGFAVLNSLRTHPRLAGTKIVAVTALAMLGDRERILSAGFDGYIAKPIEPETFARELEPFIRVRG